MAVNEPQDEYLGKAKEAENKAAHSNDRYEQESWLRIARSYRELAERRDSRPVQR